MSGRHGREPVACTILAGFRTMYALPPRLEGGVSEVTGISCPDCGGVLMVRTEGRDATLIFECRIGHTLDVPEVLAAKEERLEEHLWAAHTVLQELIELLQDLVVRGADHGQAPAAIRAYMERATRARTNSAALREVITACLPVNLAPAEPGAEGAGGASPSHGSEAAGGQPGS
jgi:hypothetical protein